MSLLFELENIFNSLSIVHRTNFIIQLQIDMIYKHKTYQSLFNVEGVERKTLTQISTKTHKRCKDKSNVRSNVLERAKRFDNFYT